MAIIKFGIINKKLLYPLIHIIIYAIINIYNSYYEDNIAIMGLSYFGVSIGIIMTFFINCKFKPKFQKEKTFKKIISKTFFSLL